MSTKELMLKLELLMCLNNLRKTIRELKPTRYGSQHKEELAHLEQAIATSFEELDKDE